jgi:hypothetical protein
LTIVIGTIYDADSPIPLSNQIHLSVNYGYVHNIPLSRKKSITNIFLTFLVRMEEKKDNFISRCKIHVSKSKKICRS